MTTNPIRLYRYRPLNGITIESLCLDELYFSSPTDFNDPFDCKPVLEPDSDLQTLQKVLYELIRRRVSSETENALLLAKVTKSDATEHANQIGQQEASRFLLEIRYQATNPDFDCSEDEAQISILRSDIEQELLRRYERGICCFSTSFNNPLLWSHYGDQHRGICVGYGLQRVPEPEIHQVIYGGSRTIKSSLVASAILDNDIAAIRQLDQDVLLRKAEDWTYENEWRLLGRQGKQESNLLLTDITFGIRCSNTLKFALIKALEQRMQEINFFEIFCKKGTFCLERTEIEFHELNASLPRTAMSGLEAFGTP